MSQATTLNHYPAFLSLNDKRCLVVGNTARAVREAERLQKSGADITLLASIGLQAPLVNQLAGVEVKSRSLSATDLDGTWLVIAASNNQTENEAISKMCHERHIFCNLEHDTPANSFLIPSTIERDPLCIAISTGGKAPILARVLRSRLENFVPTAYGHLQDIVQRLGEPVMARIKENKRRLQFWDDLFNGPVAELVFSGKPAQAQLYAERTLQHYPSSSEQALPQQGEVYLVGAGPGDPDLLTFRALRLLQKADVIFYDRLVNPLILELAHPDTEKVYVGKARDKHAVPQQSINDLLVTRAQAGQRVMRLKGGDPFIFGRGGEEIEQLAELGIPFQIVPGITAASGCAAYAGIPLTHRDHAQSCVFITGHLQNHAVNLNFNELMDPNQTIVIYMGSVGLRQICQSLIDAGRVPTTPAALVEQGTTASQQVIVGNLTNLADQVDAVSVSPPTLIIIGDVVNLHDRLKWFE